MKSKTVKVLLALVLCPLVMLVLSKVLPYIKKQELADAMMSLAVAHFENGDKKATKQTLLRLLTWRLDYKYDVNKHPPALIPALAAEARGLRVSTF